MDISLWLYAGLLILILGMACFGLYLLKPNSVWLDIFWPLHLWSAGLLSILSIETIGITELLVFICLTIWWLMLMIHLIIRFVSEPEDRRYVKIKKDWNITKPIQFYKMFLFQSFLAWILSIVFFVIPYSQFENQFLIFFLAFISLGSILGEALADSQLKDFKRENPGQTCTVGLWKYSRHPNYFFEWLFWLSLSLHTMGGPYWYIGLISPLFIFYLLVYLTGIKITEDHMKEDRKPGYNEYIKTTNAFFPWFPKK